MNKYDYTPLSLSDQDYIACLRGVAILTIVFGHVGGYWAYQPYSSYLHAFGSTFFYFLSGAVLYHSYCRTGSLYVYWIKRFSSLLVPYYFLCLIAVIVYVINNQSLPELKISYLFDWLFIQPKNEIMPFPLGQLWFLHTYILLFLVSPIIFNLYRKLPVLLCVVYFIIICVTVVQFYAGTTFIENSLLSKIYNLLFYSIFFTYGVIIYSGDVSFNRFRKIMIIFIPSFMFIILNEKINVVDSFINRDIIAVLVTLVVAGVTFVFRDIFLKVIKKINYAYLLLKFYHKNTFSVYLLHTLCIYVAEHIFGFTSPAVKTINYGISKFSVVIILCSLVSIPFTMITKSISQKIIFKVT